MDFGKIKDIIKKHNPDNRRKKSVKCMMCGTLMLVPNPKAWTKERYKCKECHEKEDI